MDVRGLARGPTHYYIYMDFDVSHAERLLQKKQSLLRMPYIEFVSLPAQITTQERMVYEGGNIVKVEEESGKWSHHFTYENGLIVSFLNIHQGDSAVWGTVSYNAEGLVEEILCHALTKTTKWNLTWVDGDATQVVEEILAPEEMADTHIYTYEYDDIPCVYTGFPMAYSIFDGDGVRVATRQSKHNRIREGYTYYYDTDNGLLISAAAENDSVSYHYNEWEVE